MFFGENRAPLRNEFLTIDYLKMLDAAGCVTTCGDALIVHHARHGLVNHFVAERAHAKAEIDIFVAVAEGWIKAANDAKILTPDQHACDCHCLKSSRPVHQRMTGRKARVEVAGFTVWNSAPLPRVHFPPMKSPNSPPCRAIHSDACASVSGAGP